MSRYENLPPPPSKKYFTYFKLIQHQPINYPNTNSSNSIMSLTLEVAILSAENLHIERKPVKKNAFVVVKTDEMNCQSTKADNEGGSNPSWDEHLILTMPMQCRFMNLEVQCKVGSGSSTNYNKLIGTASVPVSDFLGDYTPEHYLHFLSYRLRDCRGEKNGIINISVRVIKGCCYSRGVSSSADRGVELGFRSDCSLSGWQRKPPYTVGLSVGVNGDNCKDGVVMGFPVWCASRA